MIEFIWLLCALAMVCTFGYLNGRFRKRVAIWNHPPDLVLGLAGLAVFLPLALRGYASWWSTVPLLFAAAGLGAFMHAVSTGKGAKARPPELILVLYGTELMERSYKHLAALRFKMRRDEFLAYALKNGMTEESFNEWAKTKVWGG